MFLFQGLMHSVVVAVVLGITFLAVFILHILRWVHRTILQESHTTKTVCPKVRACRSCNTETFVKGRNAAS